jgi:hypothetical protein
LGNDGRIWGLAPSGIFAVNPATNEITRVAETPKPMTAGFVLDGGTMYMAAGAELWRWSMPELRPATGRASR